MLAEFGYQGLLRDVRNEPLDAGELARFLAAFGPDLVNRKSKTWRDLTESERKKPAEVLLAKYPALMKRPVIEAGSDLTMGWTTDVQTFWTGIQP